MRALVINLDRRPDRWQAFQNLNGHLPIEFERVAGIDGQTIDFVRLAATGFMPAHAPQQQYTPGSLGIALTFQSLFQRVVAEETTVLIVEDDIILSPDILKYYDAASDYLARGECDLFYLGYNFNTPLAFESFLGFKALIKLGENATVDPVFIEKFRYEKTPENDHLTVRIMHAWGMCALVISPQGAAKLLTECFPLAGPDQQIFLFGQDRHIPPIGIDAMINLRLQQMRLVAYGIVPPPCITPNNDSDTVPR